MDFKSLINKLDSMEAPPTTPKAPELPKVVQLDEDHALKVLAGTRTLNEAADLMEKKLSKAEKDKKEEVVKSMKDDKAGFKKRYGKKGEEVMHATATKIAKKKTESADDEKKNESVEVTAFKSKFAEMVAEAKKKAKPDFLDINNNGDTKESMKKAAADKKKASSKKDAPAAKKGMTDKQAKFFGKKKSVKESVFESEAEGPADLLAAVEEEINNPGGSTDNLRDVLNATFGSDRSPEFKKARAVIGKYLDLVDNASVGSKKDGIEPMRGGNIAQFIQDYDLTDRLQHAAAMLDKIGESSELNTREGIIGGAAKLAGKAIGGVAKGVGAIAGVPAGIKQAFRKGKQRSTSTISGESREMIKGKKVVAESVEQKLSFRDMMRLVVESGGQQQIDPVDKALFTWATRVAHNKLGEGMKAEVYAGLVYERMGGKFEMYDILSEDQK